MHDQLIRHAAIHLKPGEVCEIPRKRERDSAIWRRLEFFRQEVQPKPQFRVEPALHVWRIERVR